MSKIVKLIMDDKEQGKQKHRIKYFIVFLFLFENLILHCHKVNDFSTKSGSKFHLFTHKTEKVNMADKKIVILHFSIFYMVKNIKIFNYPDNVTKYSQMEFHNLKRTETNKFFFS